MHCVFSITAELFAFSEEKHNHEHKNKFMDVFQLTFKMNSMSFIPKTVKTLVVMQPVGEHYFIVDTECLILN